MIRVGIIGASGYTGVELARILSAHPDVQLTIATSRKYAGKALSEVFPSLRKTLFAADREGYSKALVKAAEVKTTILAHDEFKHFAGQSIALFQSWKVEADLAALDQTDLPKSVIHRISESLLEAYTQAPLLDRYDMYQIIMDYWFETMQDDVYVITQDGWSAGNSIRELVVKKGEKQKETPDLIVNKTK